MDENCAMTAISVEDYEEYQKLKHTHYLNTNGDLLNEISRLETENKKLKEWFGIIKTLNECNIKLIDTNILNKK